MPLYEVFCQVTGYGGTTQTASGSWYGSEGKMAIRFNADVDKALPWKFAVAQDKVEVRIGESALAFYRARNVSTRPIVGTATFNVTPLKAGQYFNKIECFCFTEQRLEAGDEIDMPVSFFVDPAIADDPNLNDVTEITLLHILPDGSRPRPHRAGGGRLFENRWLNNERINMVPPADSGASAAEHDYHGHKHPCHLVDPSPWPFFGSISAFVMAIGAVLYMHGEISWVLILGLVAVLGTMAGWFWEVIKEAEFGGYHNPVVQVGMRRHGAVYRLRSDVLRCMVLGILMPPFSRQNRSTAPGLHPVSRHLIPGTCVLIP